VETILAVGERQFADLNAQFPAQSRKFAFKTIKYLPDFVSSGENCFTRRQRIRKPVSEI
jgi:hypothetical protein